MVNLLLLMANVYASDVYEICMIKNQIWSDRNQEFETINTKTYYSYKPVQFIIHERSLELNRDKREIVYVFERDDKKCWREHKNSYFCYNETTSEFEWEFYKRNGDVTRDIMSVCLKNGEPID